MVTGQDLQKYRAYTSALLSKIVLLLQKYAMGDFSESVQIPEKEDEFTELLVGLNLMVDDIRELISTQAATVIRADAATSEMINAVARVARGDYSVQVELSGKNDEFDSLAMGLNMMIDDIRTSTEESAKSYQELQATQEASLNIMEDLDRQGKELSTLNKQLQQEINEREQAEEALRESEERYRYLFDNLNDAAFLADIETGLIVETNEQGTVLLGRSRDEIVGMHQSKLHPPGEIDKYRQIFATHIEKGHAADFDGEVIRKDGTIVAVVISASTLTIGRKRFILGLFHDVTERKRAEEEIQIQRARFESIFEHSLEGIVTLDINNNILEANTGFENIYGYEREEIMGKRLDDLIVPERLYYGEAKELDKMALDGILGYETIRKRKDGTEISVSLSAGPIKSDKEVRGRFVIFCDITERKQVEEALRQSEEKLRLMFETLPEGITIIDIDGKIVQSNKATAYIYGYDNKEEIIGLSIFEFIAKKDHTRITEIMKKTLNEGPLGAIGLTQLRKDRSEFPAEVNGTALKDASGNPIGFITITGDITERKRAEERIEHLNKVLQAIRNVNQLIAREKDRDRLAKGACDNLIETRGYCNAWLAILDEFGGLVTTAEAGLDKDFLPMVEQLKRGKLTACAQRALMQSELVVTEDPSLTCNDCPLADKYADRAAMTVRLERRGKVYGVLSVSIPRTLIADEEEQALLKEVARDIAFALHTIELEEERERMEQERRELEHKAQVASRLASIGELAAGVAHEINNPLTGVIGFAQLIMQKDIPDDIRGDLNIINEGAHRVASIVKRLLTFARWQKPEREYVDINQVIEDTLAMRAYEMETANIKVATQLAPDLLGTMADRGQLQQVFLNIIINAETEMRLAHGGGNLLIKTETEDNTIRISFKDDGLGIAEENLERIFNPFFTTREVGNGTGLGLSLCLGIITEHKGQIYAESRLGEGATFIVELPVVVKDKQLEIPEPIAEEAARAKILVVDDELAILQFLDRVLTDEGHEVEIVDNADDALERIENKRYSLILMDIKMPGMSGIELYKRIQKIAHSLARRVVFITGDVMGGDTKKFLDKAKAHYITKPFDTEQIKRDINRILTQGEQE